MEVIQGDTRLRQWPCEGMLFDTLPDGVVRYDVVGRIVAVNPAAERLLGSAAAEMLRIDAEAEHWPAVGPDGRTLPRNFHPAAVSLRTGKPVTDVVMGIVQPAHARPTWIRVNAIPVFDVDHDHTRLGVYIVFQDITRAVESEGRFRTLFEQAPLGIAMVQHGSGRILECNAACAEILGRAPEAVIGMTWQPFIHPDDRPVDAGKGTPLFASEDPHLSAEVRLLRPDGAAVWVRLTVTRARAPVGDSAPGDLIAMVQDISRERLIQDQAQQLQQHTTRIENEQRLRMAAEAARFGVFEYDLVAGSAYWSPQMRDIFGLADEVPVPAWDAGPLQLRPEGPDGGDRRLPEPHEGIRIRQDGGFDGVQRVVWPDGDSRWVRVRGEAQIDARRNRICRIHGVAVDVTEERLAREQLLRNKAALRAQAEQLQLTIEAAQLGTWSWDLQADRLTGSATGLAQLGLAPDTVLDRARFFAMVHPEDKPQVMREFSRALKSTVHREAVFRVLWPDGSEHWINAFGRSSPTTHTQPDVIWGVSRDVTEQKVAEDERLRLKERETLLQKQVAIHTLRAMAHELHQPLQAVSSLNELILQRLDTEKDASTPMAEMLELSIQQAQCAGGVLRELMEELELWNHNDAKVQLHDLGALVRRVVKRLTGHQSGLHVQMHIAPNLPKVRCYDLQTEKILSNLIGNAIEAMQDAGTRAPTLTIRVDRDAQSSPREVWVSVRDYGPGITARHASQIFDPLFSTKANGMGLGLAISRSLAQAQGGDLIVNPDCQPGAEFRLSLPCEHG